MLRPLKNERQFEFCFINSYHNVWLPPSPLKRWWRHLWKSPYTNLSISYSFLCIDQQLFQPSWFRKQYCCALMHASKNYQSSLKWTIYKATVQNSVFWSFKLWNSYISKLIFNCNRPTPHTFYCIHMHKKVTLNVHTKLRAAMRLSKDNL